MEKVVFKRSFGGFVSAFAILACTATASFAQVFYPMEVSVTSPDTGAVQTYTIYVPTEAQSGAVYTAKEVIATNTETGEVETRTIYVPNNPPQAVADVQQAAAAPVLSSNPWDTGNANTVAGQDVATTAATTAANYALASANAVVADDGTVAQGDVATAATGLRDVPLPTWVGQNTTFNTAMGQEMIAPEINKTNMISMVRHLRSLGYIVPDSLDTAIAEAPSKTKVAMLDSMAWIQNGGDATSSPILKSLAKISKDLEANYGFSFDNILGTSLNILDSR